MILDSVLQKRRFFDPKSKQDMAAAKEFFAVHYWGVSGCPFYLEFPYMTIPDMIKDKIIHQVFGLKFNRFHHIGE